MNWLRKFRDFNGGILVGYTFSRIINAWAASESMAIFCRFAMNLARLIPIKDSVKEKLNQTTSSDNIKEKYYLPKVHSNMILP